MCYSCIHRHGIYRITASSKTSAHRIVSTVMKAGIGILCHYNVILKMLFYILYPELTSLPGQTDLSNSIFWKKHRFVFLLALYIIIYYNYLALYIINNCQLFEALSYFVI